MPIAKKLLFFYLNKTACLDYTISMVELGHEFNPTVVTTEKHAQTFIRPTRMLWVPEAKLLMLLYSPVFLFRVYGLLRRLKVRSEQTSIICPSFHPYNLIIVLLTKLMLIQSYVVVHDYSSHLGEENKVLEFLQRLTMRWSSYVIFLSQSELVKAITAGFDPKRLKHFPHPVMEAKIKHIYDGRKISKALFLGRLKKYKGISLIQEAAKNLPNMHITIAGKSDDDSIMFNSPNTQFINKFLNKEEIEKLILEHDVLLLPYLDASQSGILMWGLAFNIPMIISKVGGLTEQLSMDAAIWIEPNALELVDAINHLSDNPLEVTQLKLNMSKYLQAMNNDANSFTNLLN